MPREQVDATMPCEQADATMPYDIDYRGGDWKQSRNTLRARGLFEVVVFTPQKVSQGVDIFDSCTKISLQLCEGNCQIYARTINRFPDEQRLCFYFYFPP